MPDIHLRFHQDMLVLAGDLANALVERGHAEDYPRELVAVVEPDSIVEPVRLEKAAGASCLVLPTEGICRARLAHVRAEDKAAEIAASALDVAREVPFAHVLAEIGPTGLPLDPSSASSLKANRDQYADAARLFPAGKVDALFLNGFGDVDDLRCALMGVAKASDVLVFASVDVDEAGNLPAKQASVEEAVQIMEEYGAQVCGIRTAAAPEQASAIVARMAKATERPLLAQIDVAEVLAKEPADAVPYWHPDTMLEAADALREAGAQFLRACGAATAAYTAALAAQCFGKDAVR